jgi:hypothetical protein
MLDSQRIEDLGDCTFIGNLSISALERPRRTIAYPEDRGGQLMIVHPACLALAWIAAAARLFTTARILKRQQANDYIIYYLIAGTTPHAALPSND